MLKSDSGSFRIASQPELLHIQACTWMQRTGKKQRNSEGTRAGSGACSTAQTGSTRSTWDFIHFHFGHVPFSNAQPKKNVSFPKKIFFAFTVDSLCFHIQHLFCGLYHLFRVREPGIDQRWRIRQGGVGSVDAGYRCVEIVESIFLNPIGYF